MRRFMMTFGSTLVVLGGSLVASGEDLAPAQAPEKQAPTQVQAPAKQAPAPAQAPTQKLAPVQKPTQAPTQKYAACQCQSPVQKGEAPKTAMARGGLFNRYR